MMLLNQKPRSSTCETKQPTKHTKRIWILTASVICVVLAFIVVLNTVILPPIRYDAALSLMEARQDLLAAQAFYRLGDYKDSRVLAETLLEQASQSSQWNTVSAGDRYTVGLKADGTVVATDLAKYCQRIHEENAQSSCPICAADKVDYGQCNVADWTDIVTISAATSHTVGLRADGRVVAAGDQTYGQCRVYNWDNIVAVSAGELHTVGLKADGTVVATGWNKHGQCDVSDWTDIVAVSAGGLYTVGLKADGTVVAVGMNNSGACNVSDWTDIIAISAATSHTVGLRSDGTVVATGWQDSCRCDVSDWTDIVAISAAGVHTVGLKADGTVVATGVNDFGQCDVSDWKDIKVP